MFNTIILFRLFFLVVSVLFSFLVLLSFKSLKRTKESRTHTSKRKVKPKRFLDLLGKFEQESIDFGTRQKAL